MKNLLTLDPLSGKSYVLVPTTGQTYLAVITRDEHTEDVEHQLAILTCTVHRSMESELRKQHLYELDATGETSIRQGDWFYNKAMNRVYKHEGAATLQAPGSVDRLKEGRGIWVFRVTASTDTELNADGVAEIGEEEIKDFQLAFDKANDWVGSLKYVGDDSKEDQPEPETTPEVDAEPAITGEMLSDLYNKASGAEKNRFLDLQGLAEDF